MSKRGSIAGVHVAHGSSTPVKVVDTTGASDAFAGALAVALAERRAQVDAVRFAVAASHLAVTGDGARPAPLTWSAIERL